MAVERRGFTMMELLIYMGLLAVVGMLVTAIFAMTQQTQRTTAAAYAVTGQADTAMIWIRQDFEETALGSVRVYPGTSASTIRPGVSLISARTPSDEKSPGKLRVSEYGVPLWTKRVFYALKSQPGALAGELVRWEVPLNETEMDRIPSVATMPTSLNGVDARTLLHHVVAPNEAVTGLGGLSNDTFTASNWGGFRVQFLRRQGGESGISVLTEVNPCQNATDSASNTRLIEIELAVAEPSMGKPNFYTAKFRVAARY